MFRRLTESATLREWRTIATNRLFAPSSPILAAASKAKWALFPHLVRRFPQLALLCHEPESTGAFFHALRDGMIAVDAGANLGGYAMLASVQVGPRGRVFAFEPAPDNFTRLAERLRAFPNVTPLQKALAGSEGTATLKLDSFHQGHSLVIERDLKGSVSVPVTTLDALVKELQLPGIDVVKLDVEGSELEAIDGMKGLLSGARRPAILCEVHPPITPEQVTHKLEPFGYKVRMLDGNMTGVQHAVPTHLWAEPSA